MTKKDYIVIAETLKKKHTLIMASKDLETRSLWLGVLEDFANALLDDNPNFDKARFYRAIDSSLLIG